MKHITFDVQQSGKKATARDRKVARLFRWDSVQQSISDSRTVMKRFVTAVAFNVTSGGAQILKPTPTAFSDWTAFSALYSEYRILAFRAKLIPFQLASGATGTFFTGTDRSGTLAAVASYQAVYLLDDAKISNANSTEMKLHVHEVRSTDLGDQVWYPTSTAVTPYAIQAWNLSGVNTTALLEIAVELRGSI
jgi:hypothetical protein